MPNRRIGSVTLRFGIITFVITLLATLGLRTLIKDWRLAWLISVTLVTYFTYGYDKIIAGSEMTRVPEVVLLALAVLGGTLGAIAGMRFFRHKISKDSFQFKFYLIVIVQVVVLLAYYTLFKP